MPSERLQKIISAAGITSRRNAEKMIAGGLVSVNGQIVTELGSKADIDVDHIRVNGKLLHGAEHHVYPLISKRKRYVTTLTDHALVRRTRSSRREAQSRSLWNAESRTAHGRIPPVDTGRSCKTTSGAGHGKTTKPGTAQETKQETRSEKHSYMSAFSQFVPDYV